MWVKKKERNPDWLQISQNRKKIHQTDFSAWWHNYYIFIWYIVYSYLTMDGCTVIILFVKHVKIVFVQVGVVCAVWWNLRELSQQSNNSCIRTALCTTLQKLAKLGRRQCWYALQKWLLSSYPWPNMNDQCTNVPNVLSSILRDLGLNIGFLFNIFVKTHTVYWYTIRLSKKISIITFYSFLNRVFNYYSQIYMI